MTDYLTALVARTFAPREVLQPRVPGRFEPAATEIAAPGESAGYREETQVRSSPRLEEQASAAFHRKVSPRPSMRERTRDAATPAGETPALSLPTVPLPALPATSRLLSETEAAGPELRLPVVQRAGIAPPQVTIERRIADEAGDMLAPQHTHARETEMWQTAAPLGTRERVMPPRVIERLRVRREESMAVQTAPPPVEITIGRIDVRAVVAAQPAPKAKPQPRILSLDEYAAKRDGRGK